ncbi:Hsp20 family protein [Sulfurimonas aquatica]|uniref:Hsp20 family protein n=1 Tax=Sulfurimonas aquatica TaxID=2672570 RepID=A0A975B024_9BACT|nr:Hsp20/alpha crystallin family protein [Sulfurimonas aquatica]QSZ41741.1 Hsp20 family protein [Sulfurimonas aquatica]
MNKSLKSILLISMLGASLNASSWTMNQDFNDEFSKVDKYINSMINAHFKNNPRFNAQRPKLNMYDKDDKYILEFDVAGFEKKEIKLSIDQNNLLTLEGEKNSTLKEESGSLIREEVSYGKFKRVLQLPENADQNRVDTKHKNGILSVVIYKKELEKPKSKTIEIK